MITEDPRANRKPIENGVEFDWPSVQRALGEPEQVDAAQSQADLAEALRRVFRWVADTNKCCQGYHERVGLRSIALLWVVSPDYFAGASLTGMARRSNLNKTAMSRLTAAVSREFGICNRAQAHDWRRRSQRPKTGIGAT